jgi:hypothetical protein
LNYIAQPPVLSNDTSEPWENRVDLKPFHQAVVHYAAGMLEKYRRDAQASDAQLQLFQRYVAKYLAEARTKGGRMVRFAANFFRTTRQDDRGVDPRR